MVVELSFLNFTVVEFIIFKRVEMKDFLQIISMLLMACHIRTQEVIILLIIYFLTFEIKKYIFYFCHVFFLYVFQRKSLNKN